MGSFVGAAIAARAPQRRVASAAALGERLQSVGVTLVTAELGRTSAGPVWVLTVKGRDEQLVSVNVKVDSRYVPHSPEATEDVVDRVTAYLLRPTG